MEMWKYGYERESEGLTRVLLHLHSFYVTGFLRTLEIKTVTCMQMALRRIECTLRNVTRGLCTPTEHKAKLPSA